MKTLNIATRKSKLALTQTQHVAKLIAKRHPHLELNLIKIVTDGDRFIDQPLYEVGGKGLFVSALEEAIVEGHADIAVHSLKDLPMDLHPELMIGAISERADPRDAFISNRFTGIESMPSGSIIGTSSLRREAFIHEHYPDLVVKPLRGNVDTRLNKLDNAEYDGIILASAGLIRLGLAQRITTHLDPLKCIPAAGQGAIAIECSKANQASLSVIRDLHHIESALCVEAERAFNTTLGGSCHTPIGAHATYNGTLLTLSGCWSSEKNTPFKRVEGSISIDKTDLRAACELGTQLAERLTNA